MNGVSFTPAPPPPVSGSDFERVIASVMTMGAVLIVAAMSDGGKK